MNRRSQIIFATVVVAVVLAVADTLVPSVGSEPSKFAFVASVSFAVCVFEWLRADAQALALEPAPGSRLLATFTAPFSLPVYFFWTRGARRGLWATLKAIGFLLALSLTSLISAYVASALTGQRL